MSVEETGGELTALGGRVLDVTAIHDIAVGRTVYAAAFLAAANEVGIALAIPAAALQEAWAIAEVDDHPFLDLLAGLPLAIVEPLDLQASQRSGALGRDVHAAGQWDAGAAHTVQVTHRRGWPVLTADPTPIRRIDSQVQIDLLPET